MILRFVLGKGLVSRAIAAQEKTAMPFVPSHVEYLTPDGKFYIGAHLDGGVQKRPVGYDAADVQTLPDGLRCDMPLPLAATAEQDAAFDAFMQKHVGEPYDTRAIWGFIVPHREHWPNHAICSALVALALRDCGWFQYKLAAPAHLISPRDLLLMLSARMEIPGI